jgi:hypothetical protein
MWISRTISTKAFIKIDKNVYHTSTTSTKKSDQIIQIGFDSMTTTSNTRICSCTSSLYVLLALVSRIASWS